MPELMTEAATVSLAARCRAVRSGTEALAEPLSAEDQTVQSMPDVSPTKWHRAHTSWFFEEFLLADRLGGYQVFHPAFRYLFNSYYEQVGARHPRPARGVVSRPGIAEVAAYRRHVDAGLAALLADQPSDEVLGLLELGLQHEQQHQELLLMDIKHVLSCNPLQPAYVAASPRVVAEPVSAEPLSAEPVSVEPASVGTGGIASGGGPALSWTGHPGGVVSMGHGGRGFCFDNELPRHDVLLAPFALASRPVTCGDWLAFMADGGYRRPELWLSDGWATATSQEWAAPAYWRCAGGDRWEVFTLFGPRPVDPCEPVCHVSYYEADAFARWAGARLPTEAEWEAMAVAESAAGDVPVAAEPAAHQPPGALGSVVAALHPRPVGERAALHGDVWQWTQSAYLPYPGFRPAAGAVGEYNGKFMVNQQVLRGGCCLTPIGHARSTYRNFFPPAARWPMTGLRLAADR
jgi:ergothioneine biosynthesis protein EgtB